MKLTIAATLGLSLLAALANYAAVPAKETRPSISPTDLTINHPGPLPVIKASGI